MQLPFDNAAICAAWLDLQALCANRTSLERDRCGCAARWLTEWGTAESTADLDAFLLDCVADLVWSTAEPTSTSVPERLVLSCHCCCCPSANAPTL